MAATSAPAAGGGFTGNRLARAVLYAALLVFAFYFLLPLYVMLVNSVKPLAEIQGGNMLALPRAFTTESWAGAWSTAQVGVEPTGLRPYFWNSIKMAVPATIISTILGALNGYVLSLWRFKGSDLLFGIITLGVFMPAQMALLPWAITLGSLGLTNTTSGLVLLHVVQGVAFTTLFCRNYYVNIPVDLMKAARIDGAGFWRIFHRIVLPLSPPILIVTVIWQFTGIWNEFLFAVVFSSGSQQPVTAALIALSTGDTGVRYYNVESAAVLMAAAPPLLVYLFGGKYFMRGLTQGAVK